MKINRAAWISVVDIVVFVSFVFLTATGVLLKYVLPPGSGGGGHGTGRGAMSRPVELVWGTGRHEWGDVHFWIAMVFLAAVAVHLALHWKWIRAGLRGPARAESRKRTLLAVAVLALVFGLAAAVVWGPRSRVARSDYRPVSMVDAMREIGG